MTTWLTASQFQGQGVHNAAKGNATWQDYKGDHVFWPLILSVQQDSDQGDKPTSLWVGLSLHGQLDTLKITHSRTTQTELMSLHIKPSYTAPSVTRTGPDYFTERKETEQNRLLLRVVGI